MDENLLLFIVAILIIYLLYLIYIRRSGPIRTPIYEHLQPASPQPPENQAIRFNNFRMVIVTPKNNNMDASDKEKIDKLTNVLLNVKRYFTKHLNRSINLDNIIDSVSLRKTEQELWNDKYTREKVRDEFNEVYSVLPGVIYILFYLGKYATCGASYPPESYGRDNVIIIPLRDTPTYKCRWNDTGPGNYSYIDYTVIHEMIHSLGFVSSKYRNSGLNGHYLNDRYDIMYAGDKTWGYLEKELNISTDYIFDLRNSPYFSNLN